jgi:hypothetical protein
MTQSPRRDKANHTRYPKLFTTNIAEQQPNINVILKNSNAEKNNRLRFSNSILYLCEVAFTLETGKPQKISL